MQAFAVFGNGILNGWRKGIVNRAANKLVHFKVFQLFDSILSVLTPIAAVCFAIVMVGAVVVHAQKHEYKVLPVLGVAIVLSLVVAYYRF